MNYLGLLLIAFASCANAVPADWSSYLCRYKTGEVELAQVVKLNEKERRVTLNDHDATAVNFTPTSVRFGGPHGDWIISWPSGSMVTMRGTRIGNGTCTKIDD